MERVGFRSLDFSSFFTAAASHYFSPMQVLFYTKKKSVVAASSGGDGNDTQSINGIVQVSEKSAASGLCGCWVCVGWGGFRWTRTG